MIMLSYRAHTNDNTLFFRKLNDEKMSTYKDFVKSLENSSLESSLISDLKLCEEDDIRLFTFLMPDIYTHVSQ